MGENLINGLPAEEFRKRIREVTEAVILEYIQKSGYYQKIPRCPDCGQVVVYAMTIARKFIRGEHKRGDTNGCDIYLQFPPQSHFEICPICYGGQLESWFKPLPCPVCKGKKFNVRH